MVLRVGALYPVYQPIVSMVDGSVYAHEALIRGPQGTPLHTPDALMRAAADEGLGYEFEYACLIAALRTWGSLRMVGRLFVNISANALTHLHGQHGSDDLLKLIGSMGVAARMLVLEITEHERVDDMDHLADVVCCGRWAYARCLINSLCE
jgi:EAL domain-containing protein (putative c-di-GMP-specific phosphodiesterase class I)